MKECAACSLPRMQGRMSNPCTCRFTGHVVDTAVGTRQHTQLHMAWAGLGSCAVCSIRAVQRLTISFMKSSGGSLDALRFKSQRGDSGSRGAWGQSSGNCEAAPVFGTSRPGGTCLPAPLLPGGTSGAVGGAMQSLKPCGSRTAGLAENHVIDATSHVAGDVGEEDAILSSAHIKTAG